MKTIGYWVATGLSALLILYSGALDLTRAPDVVVGLAHLGYPAYLATLLGVWKVLGAIAIVVPRFPRLKEWAYAGLAFDLTGAAVSHAASGDPVANIVTPLVILGVIVASWVLRPDSRRLATMAPLRAGSDVGVAAVAVT